MELQGRWCLPISSWRFIEMGICRQRGARGYCLEEKDRDCLWYQQTELRETLNITINCNVNTAVTAQLIYSPVYLGVGMSCEPLSQTGPILSLDIINEQ